MSWETHKIIIAAAGVTAAVSALAGCAVHTPESRTPAPSPTPTPTPSAHIGQPLRIESLTFTATDLKRAHRIFGLSRPVTANGVFIVITFKVTNTGGAHSGFAGWGAILRTKKGTTYQADLDGVNAASADIKDRLNGSIEPGRTVTRRSVFDIPKDEIPASVATGDYGDPEISLV